MHQDPCGSASLRRFPHSMRLNSGLDSDVEVICLMLEALNLVGIDDVLLDLGHVGIFTILVEKAGLSESQQMQLQTLQQLVY